ncbi:MAG TPA: efflux RND transporter periplasmic adaptor subunit [Candidatus Binataceae bacterium]|nr:efflux RND transporter periplasmic adaptor subunit [Candidatus Binataceae bacterium]
MAIALIAAMALLSMAGCGKSKGAGTAAGSHSETTKTASAKGKVLYWKSSMVPGYRSDKPGKDSMGMDLVPVYEGEAPKGPPGTVAIRPETIQQIGVKTTVVRRETLRRDLRTNGRIDYDESLVTDVAPKIGGWVEKQFVNFPGQMVRKGQPLGTIYSPELVATEEEYLNALKYRDSLKNSPLEDASSGAQSLVQAVETRLRYWDITDAQIKTLRERGKITRTMMLHAPFTGIVVKKNVFQGGFVKPGETMYRLADISNVWVYADVYEYEAPWLRLGQEAIMTLSYDPGARYRGRVTYIYPYLKTKTRTLEVRMEFRNGPHFELKPGMWANVNLEPEVAREALVVPVEAVIRTGKKDFVILALGGGRFLPRQVELGAQAGNDFEVLSGLKAGDRIVDSAEFLINSESSLQSAFNKMTPPSSSAVAGPNADAPGQIAPTPAPPEMP